MKTKTQKTKNQHYISQMILKNFSNSPENSKHKEILQYDIYKKTTRMVDIKGECKKRNLYEFKNNDNQSCFNYVEKYFSFFERKWSVIFNKIINKKEVSEEEKIYLYLFMTIQFLRTSCNIKVAQDLLKEFSQNSSTSDDQRKNYILLNFFGIMGVGEIMQNTFFEEFVNNLKEYTLNIYRSEYPLIINNTNIVHFLSISDPLNKEKRYSYFIATISPSVCVILSDNKKERMYIDMPKEMSMFINQLVINEQINTNNRYLLMNKNDFENIVTDIEKYIKKLQMENIF